MTVSASPPSATELVRRFYDELWNRWRLDVADEILAEDVAFRGTLGSQLTGRDAFKNYVALVRMAFPDWFNQIDEMVDSGNRVVTRMTWTGTHLGRLGHVEPTGRTVTYPGAGFFTITGGVIARAWIVGDTARLWTTLGHPPPKPPEQ
jgi:steroid delta-isomerase-like uncharacterized protein